MSFIYFLAGLIRENATQTWFLWSRPNLAVLSLGCEACMSWMPNSGCWMWLDAPLSPRPRESPFSIKICFVGELV